MQLARIAAPLLAGALTLVAVACGSDSDSEFPGENGASSSSGASGGSSGFGASSGGASSGASGGENCAATSAQTQKAKVDIVFVIDNSGSMTEEMDQIKKNVNTFAGKILNVGLDLHVVFIVRRGTSGNTICVPEPLAAANCADKAPTFRHVDESVGSHDSFEIILDTYDSNDAALAWKDELRLDSTKVFVEVTDDESNMPFMDFDTALLAKQPAGIFGTAQARKYVFHSIISKPFADPVPSTNLCIDPDTGDVGADGTSLEYQNLSKLTGGLIDEVCKKDYSGVLDNIAKSVVDKLGCELTYPKAEAADPTKLVVQFTPQGQPGKPLTQVTDTSKCGTVQDGWFYDDNANPTKIVLCPSMCTTANASPGAKIEALVGCKAPAPR